MLMARKWFEKGYSTQIFKTMARITRNLTEPASGHAIIQGGIGKNHDAAREHFLFRVIRCHRLKNLC